MDIQKNLDHPGVIQIYDVVQTETQVNIVMELAAGGDLFDQVSSDYQNELLTEGAAKFQFWQISNTIAYLHKNKVCHRDLKLENILLVTKSRKAKTQITDFDLSKVVANSTSPLESLVGTPIYMAPEVFGAVEKGSRYSLKS